LLLRWRWAAIAARLLLMLEARRLLLLLEARRCVPLLLLRRRPACEAHLLMRHRQGRPAGSASSTACDSVPARRRDFLLDRRRTIVVVNA